jgi:hypothetical protein
LLAAINVNEDQALEHSPEWIIEATQAVVVDRLEQAKVTASLTFTAVQAAYHGEDAVDIFREHLDSLDDPFGEAPGAQMDDEGRLQELFMLTNTIPVREQVSA